MSNEWQPIETAPRDGRYLILSTEVQLAVIARFLERSDGSCLWEMVGSGEQIIAVGDVATHWMPLPEPPND